MLINNLSDIKPKILTEPMTRDEVLKISEMEIKDRVIAMRPGDPRGFLRFATYNFTDQIEYEFADFHYVLMEILYLQFNGNSIETIAQHFDTYPEVINEILVIGFREGAKTTIFKMALIYVICYELRKYINVDSRDKTNSERILFDVVLHLQNNKRIIKDFGNLYTSVRTKDQTEQKRISDFTTNRKPNEDGSIGGMIRVEAHTTQSDVRGRLHNGSRPDLMWLEDFETEITIRSEVETSNIASHISAFKGGLAHSGAWIWYTANYLSEYGNVEGLIQKSKIAKDMVGLIIPIYDSKNNLAWPQKYSLTDMEAKISGKISIQAIKEKMYTIEKGDAPFVAEMLCMPIDYATQEFKQSMFKFITWQELLLKRTRLTITIDSGGSSKDGQKKKLGERDDTGVVYNWVDEDGNWHIKSSGKLMDSKEIMELIFDNNLAYDSVDQGIEKTMFTSAIKPFFDEAKKDRNQYPRLRMLETGGRDKKDRIRGLIPRFEAGKIYFIQGENDKLIDQLLRFPVLKHDDVVDALAYQNDMARKPVAKEDDEMYQARKRGVYATDYEDRRSAFSEIGL
mgnify:FL=1